jgi:hypothetical protein
MKNSSLYTNVRTNQIKIAIFMVGFFLLAMPGKTDAKLISVGTSADIVSFGNNVGIGSTAPNQILHVFDKTSNYATINIEGKTDTSDAGAAILFNEGNGATQWEGGLYGFKVAYDGGNNYLYFEGFGNGSSAGKHLSILRTGNVGIGLTNPGTKLDITGTLRNSLATTHSLLGGAGNAVVMTDNTGSLFSMSTATFAASAASVSTLYHIKPWFVPAAGQTISSSGATVTMLNPVSNFQFSSSMIGSKLTINGESRIITAYTSTSVVTVDSAYSTNYSAVSNTLWGVYSRAVDIASDGSIVTYSEVGGTAIKKRSGDGNVYIPALLDSSSNYYLPSSVLYLDKDFPIKWSGSTSYSSSANDVGLRRTASGTLEIFDGTGTTPGTVADYRDLNLRSLNPAGGNIGIGTTTAPQNKLVVVTDQSGGGVIKVQNTNIASWSSYEMFDYLGVHKASFGYANPNAPTVAGLAHFSTSDDTPFIIAIHDLEKMRVTTDGYIGIGTTNPTRPLQISSTSTDAVEAGDNNSILFINGLMNSVSRQQSGIVVSPWVNPPSASTQTYIGLNFIPNSNSPYVSGAKIMGLYGGTYYYGTSTLGQAYGGIFKNFADETSKITNSYGVYIDDAYKAAGASITNNYGLYITSITAGTNDYAIYSQGGKNYFGGNIGIGTTAPVSLLDVNGSINMATGTSLTYGGVDFLRAITARDDYFLGNGAGNFTTTGSSNEALGSWALHANTSGSWNVAIGGGALINNTTGYGNVAINDAALNANISGNENTGVGDDAIAYNTTGSYNSGYGGAVLLDLTTGSNNTALGYNSGRGLTTGGANTIIGANVSGLAANLSNNIIIADGDGNQRINVNSSGNVGIGTTNPKFAIHVAGDVAGNSFVSNPVDGDTWDGNRLEYGTYGAGPSYGWKVFVNGGEVADFLNDKLLLSSGNVGIGVTNPAAKLAVAGTTKLGTAGSAFTAMGTCIIASSTITTTKVNKTCTGIPASTVVAVSCTGSLAFSGVSTIYCRPTGTADQLACNTIATNTTGMPYTCMWVQP